jgi:receptor protein-tyrosine kinase
MSIIERAAGKIPPSSGTSQPPPAQPGGAMDRSLIESSIAKVEASFGDLPRDSVMPRPPQPGSAEEGPPTIISQQGSVNLARLKQMGALTPEGGRSKIAEEYRLIKRPLLINAFGQGDRPPLPNGNMIMVTSSLPGEGKSFTAINLAISMATEMENTVLLVDADVTKTAILKYLGLQGDRGLIDVLLDPSIPLSDVLIKTDIAKLTVLPAGRAIAHSTELLASSAMRSFVHDISTRYPDRIVIFDTPPLLSTSEASVLASYMGQVVFVVEAERTPQEAIREALSHIAGHASVGLVLNKAPVRSMGGDYYGYGYGYGYGSYGEYGKQ